MQTNLIFFKFVKEFQLERSMADMFIAGTETGTTISLWVIAYLLNHRRVLCRMQKEIDDVIGKQIPSYSDRDSLPYFMAVLTEVSRCCQISAIGGLRSCTESFECQGYTIPKGTTLLMNLGGLADDPVMFPNPEKFDPGRYLDADGNLMNNADAVLIFGYGN